jgi:hypothetical protein
MDIVDHSFVFETYDLKLDVVRKILLENKCVCEIGERGGNIMYF